MNYYNILNLPLYSDIKDIKTQYLILLKSTKNNDKIKELNKIYTFLKDPLNKFNYDNQLKEELENNKNEKSNLDEFYDDLNKNKLTDDDVQKILIEHNNHLINENINSSNDFIPMNSNDDDINFNNDDINNDLYKDVDELYKKSKQDKNIDEYIKAREEELKIINSLNK